MPSPTPALETVLTAIKAAIVAALPTSTVREFERTLDSEIEFVEQYQNPSTYVLDLWLIDVENIAEPEGPASGENYSIYEIRIRYLSTLKADAEWGKKARIKIETVRDALNGAASVFAIGGQRQLRTPETCSLRSFGFDPIEDQFLYVGVLSLQVEARRWL